MFTKDSEILLKVIEKWGNEQRANGINAIDLKTALSQFPVHHQDPLTRPHPDPQKGTTTLYFGTSDRAYRDVDSLGSNFDRFDHRVKETQLGYGAARLVRP